MRIKIYRFILVVLIVNMAFSQELTQYKNFADYLYKKGEYYRAITEYYRINTFFPDNPYFVNNLLKIASCYSYADYYLESIQVYKQVLDIDKLNWEAIYHSAEYYFNLAYYIESNAFLQNHLDYFTDGKHDSLQLLTSINYLYLGEFEKSKSHLGLIKYDGKLINKSNLYQKIIDDQIPLLYKSKSAAFGLSLIPGLGYIYSDKYETGISAFVVNILFGYATYLSFKNENNGVGIVLGLFTLGFYSGSIYGSFDSVNEYNKKIKINFYEQFKF